MVRRLLELVFPLACPCCGDVSGAPCRRCVGEFVPAHILGDLVDVDHAAAAYAYAGGVRNVVLACKRSNEHALARFMAAEIYARAPVSGRPDAVTWVPTTSARIRNRGYDHAEEIARPLARNLRVPCVALLTRRSAATSHVDGASDRPKFAARRACPPNVLLIDDVCTTGRSLEAAAAALKSGGASAIVARTFAATPAPSFTNDSRNSARQLPGGWV